MLLTGRRDEWIVRLPGALAGWPPSRSSMRLGRRMGGRALGLASAFILCSLGFFVGEMRQASNDGPLALFTTLALFAAYRCFHDDDENSPVDDEGPREAGTHSGARRSGASSSIRRLGLGFLTKGPVILLLVGVTVVPYLACSPAIDVGPAQAV